MYRPVHTRAPQATIVVAGCPRVFNGEDCNALTWFSPTEMSRLNATADLLNKTIASAASASAAGVRVVDPTAAFLPHAVCADVEWLNGLSSPVVESYHPNLAGQSAGYAPLVGSRLTGSAVTVTAATLQLAEASAQEQAAKQRPRAAMDRRTTPKSFVAPDLSSPRMRAAAARAGVDLRSRASIDAADRAHEAAQHQADAYGAGMSDSRAPCVVFDLGGVLLRPEGPAAHLAHALGVTVEQVLVPYWRHRDDYDRGGEAEAFWTAVRRDLVADGCTLRPVTTEQLDRIDAERWAQLSDGAEALLVELGEHGTATAVLSNAPASLATTVRAAPWSREFEELVFSCELGMMKPEPAIYRAVEQRTGRRPDELLFFDDRPVNVAGAAARGWQAHLWAGLPAARPVLVRAGALRP